MGIKKQTKKPKVSNSPLCEKCPHKISVSFKYLTTNNGYNFEYFKTSQERESTEAKAALYDKIENICNQTWVYWQQQGKSSGFETINVDRLKFSPKDYVFSNDQKFIVFRFCSGRYRIIGIKATSCTTYDIIGFDFDHSSYNHGS